MTYYKGDQLTLLRDPNYQRIIDTIDLHLDGLYLENHQTHLKAIADAITETAETFGPDVANDLIIEFELEQHGWYVPSVDEDI